MCFGCKGYGKVQYIMLVINYAQSDASDIADFVHRIVFLSLQRLGK